MMTEEKLEQRKFDSFEWQVPQIVTSIAQGEDAEALYNALVEDVKTNYHNHSSFTVSRYDPETKSILGSNIPLVSRLNELVEPSGLRTAVPADDQYGDISRLVQGRFYTTFNALVLRTRGDNYKPNDSLAKDLADKVEQKQGRLNLPVMIVRPVARYSENSEYGFFTNLDDQTFIIEDPRLDGEKYPTGMKFDNVDELGLPIFDKKGERTWYAREGGLSGFDLNSNLLLYSSDERLAYSLAIGRVVLVRGEAAPQKISESLSVKDKSVDINELERIYNALGKILGKQ